jgi:hypothetical protein
VSADRGIFGGQSPPRSKSAARPAYELSYERLIEFGERSASEMVDKFGIPHDKISRDTNSGDWLEEQEFFPH